MFSTLKCNFFFIWYKIYIQTSDYKRCKSVIDVRKQDCRNHKGKTEDICIIIEENAMNSLHFKQRKKKPETVDFKKRKRRTIKENAKYQGKFFFTFSVSFFTHENNFTWNWRILSTSREKNQNWFYSYFYIFLEIHFLGNLSWKNLGKCISSAMKIKQTEVKMKNKGN